MLLETFERKAKGELRFVGGKHPSFDMSRGGFDGLVADIEASAWAEFVEPKPFDELKDMLCGCGAAFDLMARNPERELAFPSRTAVYLWCGLPVIFNDYSEFSGLIREYDAGWCLDPNDAEGLRGVVEEILDTPEMVERKRENARRLAHEKLNWNETIKPLADWCGLPQRRKKADFLSEEELERKALGMRVAHLEDVVAELRGRRLVKASELLREMKKRLKR